METERKKRLFYMAVKRLLKEKMRPGGEKSDRMLNVEEAIALTMIKKAMGGDMAALKWLSELMDGEEGPEGSGETVRIEVVGREV